MKSYKRIKKIKLTHEPQKKQLVLSRTDNTKTDRLSNAELTQVSSCQSNVTVKRWFSISQAVEKMKDETVDESQNMEIQRKLRIISNETKTNRNLHSRLKLVKESSFATYTKKHSVAQRLAHTNAW